jgi:hypothetical protein
MSKSLQLQAIVRSMKLQMKHVTLQQQAQCIANTTSMISSPSNELASFYSIRRSRVLSRTTNDLSASWNRRWGATNWNHGPVHHRLKSEVGCHLVRGAGTQQALRRGRGATDCNQRWQHLDLSAATTSYGTMAQWNREVGDDAVYSRGKGPWLLLGGRGRGWFTVRWTRPRGWVRGAQVDQGWRARYNLHTKYTQVQNSLAIYCVCVYIWDCNGCVAFVFFSHGDCSLPYFMLILLRM